MNAKRKDFLATIMINLIVAVVVGILVFLLAYILISGLPHVSWSFLTGTTDAFSGAGGIGVQLFNSFYLLVLTMVISIPISLGAGIYLAEYAKDNWRTSLIRSAIEVLSSLPSVVVGLFGFLLFVVQFKIGFSVISGAIALTFFNLPLLTRNIEESLSAVSRSQREAGLSLGLSKWKTEIGIILPVALPGIVTGVVLSAGRVFGEAAALIYTAGQSAPVTNFADWNPMDAASPLNPLRPAETLAVHIWKVNTEGLASNAAQLSAAASAVLIIAVLIFNLGARVLGMYLYRRVTASNK
ncbi:phosphate ABC transporter permease PstA [Levilactobacillus brevis]|uniref:Phosphate transport system permease protein PstA n=2 Tax=Levilactobacillus brevis TaxID=1580 RepID=A0A0C1M264_LEVBR|nr:phosphate ABC transporter permease PstA [Levilactobacillus brevis]AJA80046.1 phosphate ABC transporter permease [Levilactobacillus brevis BSO 464]ARN89508.1 phosphate ABC transporter, permease protein PstA [Levilactobacillus brevis]ARN93261.1 phosphate ABC transporter, permease protein PstA [Levilactobacillus brevis]ARN95878.1 phosphate ABC transporter, permease protein PstA [Levilactobacillus brevis]ARN97079.1 phosphate ABC transporter, permease protein PstA [Levilactobacillus brevis]